MIIVVIYFIVTVDYGTIVLRIVGSFVYVIDIDNINNIYFSYECYKCNNRY